MATDKSHGLALGDIAQIKKLTTMLRMGPERKGFSYDYVKRVLDEHDPRQNEEILAIARDLVAARERSMAALLEVRAKQAAKKQQRKTPTSTKA